MKRKATSAAEIIAVNNLSISLSKLQRSCTEMWEIIHTSSEALFISKKLDSLSELMQEVQERIDDIKEMHAINVRQTTLALTKKFREKHDLFSNQKEKTQA